MNSKITNTISCFFMLCSLSAFGQYSNASLSGPWMTQTDTDTYLLFDGNGNISEFGVFNGAPGTNVGTYSVNSTGAISGELSIFSMTFTGQLTSANAGSLDVAGVGTLPLNKVTSPGALTDTLTGTFVDDSTATTKTVMFKLNADGQIIDATGLTGVTGRIYAENGVFVGHLESTDNSMGSCWTEMMIAGTYSGNTLSGTLKMDCTGHGGTVSLTRSGNATLAGLFSAIEKNQFTVFPNPFVNSFSLGNNPSNADMDVIIYNAEGKKILEKTVSAHDQEIAGLDNLDQGVYVLRITQNNISTSYRIVKQ